MHNLEIFEFETIASTNNFLLKQKYHNKNQLCIAKIQTAGKGQYGRKWLQQKRNALFSLKIKLPATIKLNGLSLVVGLAIIQVLENNYKLQNLQIKWPNDIFLAGKKLGGVLIENQFYNTFQYIVIGVGINIKSDIFASIGQNINNKQLILRLVDNILLLLTEFKHNNFIVFIQRWQKYDFLKNQKITINYKNQLGLSDGVDAQGFLIFKNSDNQAIIHSSSQIST